MDSSTSHKSVVASAEAFLHSLLVECARNNVDIAILEKQLKDTTHTILLDWVDYFAIGASPVVFRKLEEYGFQTDLQRSGYSVYYHPQGVSLPRVVVLSDLNRSRGGIAVCVDSIAHYLAARGLHMDIEGAVFSGYRQCCISTKQEVSLWIIERNGIAEVEVDEKASPPMEELLMSRERWKVRPRGNDDPAAVLRYAIFLTEKMVHAFGADIAASLVMKEERAYWEWKHPEAVQQKQYHDKLGLGWGKHRGCTFRTSRRYFPVLVRLFDRLGFQEIFFDYHQEERRGSLLMTQESAGFACTIEVDLLPEEAKQGFSRSRLPELEVIGAVDLWCAIHGESIAQGGLYQVNVNLVYDEAPHEETPVIFGASERPSGSSAAATGKELRGVSWEEIAVLIKKGKITEEQGKQLMALAD